MKWMLIISMSPCMSGLERPMGLRKSEFTNNGDKHP